MEDDWFAFHQLDWFIEVQNLDSFKVFQKNNLKFKFKQKCAQDSWTVN